MSADDTVQIDADDLAMLASGFESAMLAAPGPGAADAALYDLGWGELLAAAPALGAATAFAALGRTGSAAGILDDVLAVAFGVEPSLSTCIVLPRPHRADPPGRRDGDTVFVDGLVSPRVDTAETAIVAVATDEGIEFVTVDAERVRSAAPHGLDPGAAYRRVTVELGPDVGARFARGRVRNEPRWRTWSLRGRVRKGPTRLLGGGGGGGAGGAGAPADRRLALDARRRPDARDRSHPVRPVRWRRSRRCATSWPSRSWRSRVPTPSPAPAPTTSIRCWPPSPSRSPARRHARPPPTPNRCSPASASRPTTSSTCWLKRTLVVDTVFGSASSIPTEIGAELLARGGAPRLLEL